MFVHLRLHSEFSVVDGSIRVADAVAAAAADGQPALAMTDLGNLFGAVKFYTHARGKGVKPILGADVALNWPTDAQNGTGAHVLLLVQNRQGYLNLCELLTRMWTVDGARIQPACEPHWLQELGEGLILLSGAQGGPVGAALMRGDVAAAEDVARRMAADFPGRFYIELQRAGRSDDEAYLGAAVPLAARLGLPVVATQPVQFLKPEDFQAHEARVCIAGGEVLSNKKRPRLFTQEQYFKTQEQMQALFADIPSALANTVEIARRCSLELELGKAQLPDFPVPAGMTTEAFFRQQSQAGLNGRLLTLYPDGPERNRQRPRYQERLEFELDTIVAMGFPGYFLIVGDFIQWARNNGCPVGPGRGSGAGSLVAYALGITDLDPLQYNLLFERFLNPERVSMPDFDIDFCQANRDRVIDYVKHKYGRNAVSQIATFGTMAARAAIRDVGRVMGQSYGFCDAISKLIPNKPGKPVTLQYPPPDLPADQREKYAIAAEPLLAGRIDAEEEVRALVEMAQKLEGLTRNVGMHAGGVLIAPGKLTDFCPLYRQPGSTATVSQYDKDDVEAIGLVKFDFLGLATLTILEIAQDLVRKRHAGRENFSCGQIPLDDARVYRLFQEGMTEAVFQFESRGMQGMLREARPTRLEDLIALNALYRPGPMDLIPDFVARKHGKERVVYPHPTLEPVLAETYGIMVYQEQVMQTAQVLGGYTLGGADMLRRAMGKKKAEEMALHREIFRKGAAEKNIPQDKADEVFDLMEKFAGYGFNKSHAAAYSLLAYQTAWLKVHCTAEFFCANMTVEMDNTDKLRVLYEDAVRNFGLEFEPPDINRGFWQFEPVSDKVIRYGLGAVKGTGQQAIEAIVRARDEGGAFASLFDFCCRVDRASVNKRAVEALVKAGAFDSISPDRATLCANVDLAFEFAQAAAANAQQVGLFDAMGNDALGSSTREPEMAQALPWGVRERLMQEKGALGFYLSGHLFDEAEAEVRRFVPRRIGDLIDTREQQLVAGIVSDLHTVNGVRGRTVIFTLGDKSASIEVVVDERIMEEYPNVLADDALVIMSCTQQPARGGYEARLAAKRLWTLESARCRFARYLRVRLNGHVPDIAAVVDGYPPRRVPTPEGDLMQALPVHAIVQCPAQPAAGGGNAGAGQQVQVELQLGDKAAFFPCDAALAAWRALAEGGQAEIVYE